MACALDLALLSAAQSAISTLGGTYQGSPVTSGPLSESLPPSAEQGEPEDQRWLASVTDFEQNRAHRINVPDTPSTWHPALLHLRKNVAETVRKTPKRREYAEDFRGSVLWLPYWKETGRWDSNRSRAMPLRVSAGCAVRALAFVNAVFLAAHSRGAEATVDEGQGNFALILHGYSLYFAVRERFDKELKQSRDKTYRSSAMVEVPTGRLFVAIQKPNRWQYSIHAESTDRPLKELANLPYERLYSIVLLRRQEERTKAEEKRRQLIVQREMEELAAQRELEKLAKAEADRLAAVERAKDAALLQEARNWESAALIRRYLEALGSPTTEDQGRWQAGAKEAADRLDPMKRRP